MNSLIGVGQSINNPLVKQQLINDATLDNNEMEMAKKAAKEFHEKLDVENYVEGEELSTGARLAQIVASKLSV